MEEPSPSSNGFRKSFIITTIATLLFGAIPFLLYLWGRLSGELPTYEVWLQSGFKDGPWMDGYYMIAIVYSAMALLALATWTFFYGCLCAIEYRRFMPFLSSLILTITQLGTLAAQIFVVWWVVD